MAEFYSTRSWEIPPLPWTNLSPPFSPWGFARPPRWPGCIKPAGRAREARQALAPVHDWFGEGFETADLKAAKTLLDAL